MEANTISILAIDDDHDSLDILEVLGRTAVPGIKVLTASEGPAGLALALAENPDVILLDIVMPGMDGFAVCRRLKADSRLKNIPVVFMTADKTDKESRIKAIEAGGEGFLPKPFEVEELVAQVRAMAKIKAGNAALSREKDRLKTLVAERTRALELELSEKRLGQERLLKLSDQVPGVIYQYREFPDGRACIPYSSSGMNTIFEVKPEEVSEDAAAVLARVHPEDREGVDLAIRESARALTVLSHEFRVVLPGQGLRWRLCCAKPERVSDGGTLWHGIVTDITEAKQVAAALLESKNIIESVLENVPLMVFLKEAKSQRFVMFNRAGEELLGYDRKALLGKNDLDFFPPEQAAGFMARDREVLDGEAGALDIPEEPIQTAKKGLRLLHTRKVRIRGSDGAPKYLLGISEDITDRKQAEEALRGEFEMQGVLNAMLQHSLLNMPLRDRLAAHLAKLFALPWLAIQPKGAVFLMNAGGTGLDLAAQQGMVPTLLETCAHVRLGSCLCGKAAESGLVVEDEEVGAAHAISCEGIAAHGHYCSPIIAGSRTLGVLNLYLQEGVPLTDSQRLFIRSVTDIMAEDILHARTEEKLVHSQRMESVGRLAGGIAHDFNNILTAIKCYTEFIGKGLGPQDPMNEDVKEVLKATNRAVGLTRQLLAFSRRQILAPKVTDLNTCVSAVSNMLKRLIGEELTLEAKFFSAPCLALFDTGQLEQVLVNLVVNARDATPAGGVIKLSTELLPPSPELHLAHPDLPRGALVCLTVEDAGVGMSADIMSHLFEPFFTTKERGRGTGLGLSTVFGIIRQSGGEIEVESEPEKGSKFRIFLPYCEGGAAETSLGGPAAAELKGRETILLVEDEESLRRIGRRVLESSGYEVITAADGQGALKELERHGKPVDLLLTDVIMPGMNGRDLARELSLRKLAGRTLYMSGYTDDAIIKHGVLEPGIAFIYKPFTIDGLLLKVRATLDAPSGQAMA